MQWHRWGAGAALIAALDGKLQPLKVEHVYQFPWWDVEPVYKPMPAFSSLNECVIADKDVS